MTYPEFNDAAYRYFLKRANSPYCTLGVDQDAINWMIKEEPLPIFIDLKESWVSLLDIVDEVPQYFGLLAIQCYAATLMEN